MELFVVNRHDGALTQPDIDEEANIGKLLKRIEKNKLKRQRQKQLKKESLAAKSEVIERTKEKRRRKREEAQKHVVENEPEQKAVTDVVNGESLPQKPPKKKAKTDLEGFTVLGVDNFDKNLKAKRVLPKWLTTPTVISTNLQELDKKVSSIKALDKSLRKRLTATGIKHFFPVQAEVIPWLLRSHKDSNFILPRDICVSAPTGSGKTLAFVLPIIQALKSYQIRKIRALIILPTQDLALQVFSCFKKFSQGTHLEVRCITGKTPFASEQAQLIVKNEVFGYVSKVDILVCTAGRLVEHLKETEGFNLRELTYLVIDEADRVLDTIQNDWLYHLEKHMYQDDISLQPSKILNLKTIKARCPQKLLFSATLSQDPEKLQKLSLFQPKLFTSVLETNQNESVPQPDKFIGKYTTPTELTEKYIQCTLDLKPLVLYEFIKQNNLTKTLIFLHSVEMAHRLAILLQGLFKDNLKIEEAASQLETNVRNTLIKNFCEGSIDILVCTDRLARGMDFASVQCVISYSPPKYLKTYIHRVGRTARAGEPGLAVTLLHKTQLNKFLHLLQQGGKNSVEEIIISEECLEEIGEYQAALKDLANTVANEEEVAMNKIKSQKKRLRKTKIKRPKMKLNKIE